MPDRAQPQRLDFRPRPETVRNLVHMLARDTGNIAWSAHALERMSEREITDLLVIEVLRSGWP